MPMYSTYKQYWEAHEKALDDVIDVGGQLRNAIGVRDGVGRELKEAEGVAPQEDVAKLREDHTAAEGRVEKLQKEFVDAQGELSTIELDAASVEPGWAAALEEGIAPDGSRRSDKPGMLDQLQSFIGDAVDAARDGAEKVAEKAGEMVDKLKEGAGKVADNVKEHASEMVDKVKEGAGEVADHARELYEKAEPTLHKVKEGAELVKEVWEGVEPAVKAGLETAKTAGQNTLAAGAMLGASLGTPAASGDLLQQMENPTAGLQAAVQEVIHEQAQLPPGVPQAFVTNPHEAPKGPEGPDFKKEQEDWFEAQNGFDKDEREREGEVAAHMPQTTEQLTQNVEPDFEMPKVDDSAREAPPAEDHPGSLTAYQSPLEDPGAVYAELNEGMNESALVRAVDRALGSASESELNSEPPPPPPPPPPEEDPHKGLGH